MGIRVLTPNYQKLESVISHELHQCLDDCRDKGRRLLIYEVGGIAVKALHTPNYWGENWVIGALEITKQGVWVAENLEPYVYHR